MFLLQPLAIACMTKSPKNSTSYTPDCFKQFQFSFCSSLENPAPKFGYLEDSVSRSVTHIWRYISEDKESFSWKHSLWLILLITASNAQLPSALFNSPCFNCIPCFLAFSIALFNKLDIPLFSSPAPPCSLTITS